MQVNKYRVSNITYTVTFKKYQILKVLCIENNISKFSTGYWTLISSPQIGLFIALKKKNYILGYGNIEQNSRKQQHSSQKRINKY